MLVATRDLKVFGSRIKAGEPIPNPKKWHPSSLQSAINIGWVKEVNDEVPAVPSQVVAEQVVQPPQEASEVTEPEVSSKPETATFSCCGKVFKSKRALTLHSSRSHK